MERMTWETFVEHADNGTLPSYVILSSLPRSLEYTYVPGIIPRYVVSIPELGEDAQHSFRDTDFEDDRIERAIDAIAHEKWPGQDFIVESIAVCRSVVLRTRDDGRPIRVVRQSPLHVVTRNKERYRRKQQPSA